MSLLGAETAKGTVATKSAKEVESSNVISSLSLETSDDVADLNKNVQSAFIISDDQVENVYDNWAANYDEDTDKLGFASPLACASAAVNVSKHRGARLLDVGCGTGLLGKICEDLGFGDFCFDGMDLSEEMLQTLRSKGRANIYKSIIKHDLSEMPWPLESKAYDCTVCNGVLIYIKEPKVLEEFVRVTKKAGHCCIMFRDDGYPEFEEKDNQMRAEGQWQLVSKSEPQLNFPDAPEDSPSRSVKFSIYTYEVLV